MKAHIVRRVVNYLGFVLTGWGLGIAVLGISTLLAWWFLSDYYLDFPGLDTAGYVVASLVFLFVLVVFCLIFGGPEKADGARIVLIKDTDDGPEVAVKEWLAAIQHERAASRGRKVWKSYLGWHWKHLSVLSGDQPLPPKRVPYAWWATRSAIWTWVFSCWLLALWLVLWWVPRHTTVMGRLASLAGEAPRILAVDCIGRDPRTGAPIRERLRFQNGVFTRTGKSVFLSGGTFRVSTSAFPRAYHTLNVFCLDLCSLSVDITELPHLQHTYEIRGGWKLCLAANHT